MPSKSGPKPHTRRTLAPAFILAIKESGRTAFDLSRDCGFTYGYAISSMRLRPFAATPLITGRLTLLAGLLAYDGPLFEGDDIPVVRS